MDGGDGEDGYDLQRDGEGSYLLAMRKVAERWQRGECLRKDGRCMFCREGECRLKVRPHKK